ncbi:uncharacterized protein PHALS_07093 [Plasmopara halstedii]|uniref:Uncharacterized protein n=1 Tax=Plasmopara halstedii TaxID=4781 RepID=A0A0N7L8A4_PLAHL|nr:uncharacterized protein PHALS_07093 [Plasmopara halstedii]CEG49323.1 hypothetical protein PHALS_07093 [Plasmopara halstedii]|eukprot:XP_024585692.1 hypothetical protein PHALS_07093 [Plasmopara halstedii]
MSLIKLLRARDFSTLKRAKPIRVKKSESRRVIPKQTNALTQVSPPPPTIPFLQSEQQAPQTFGGIMKESFMWGMGMAAAFSVVGIIFSSMEETNSPGEYKSTVVVVSQEDQEESN